MFFIPKEAPKPSPPQTGNDGGPPPGRESGPSADERQAEREKSGPVAEALARTLRFRLRNDVGEPVSGQPGRILLSNGETIEFTTGSDGRFFVGDLEPGLCYEIQLLSECSVGDEDNASNDAPSSGQTSPASGATQQSSSNAPPCSNCDALTRLVQAGTVAQQCRRDSKNQEAIKALQAHLVAFGHDLGSSAKAPDGVDGFFGDKTQNALQAFLRSHGRSSSGQALSASDAELLGATCRDARSGNASPNRPTPPPEPSSSSTSPGSPKEELLARIAQQNPQHDINPQQLETAVDYYFANEQRFPNKRVLSVIDFTQHSMRRRWHLVNLQSGKIESIHVTHGEGSDPGHTGVARQFSNTPNSHMTSLGFYKTDKTYSGTNGYSLKLDGLSPTNSNARARYIVVHGANYAHDDDTRKQGRSQGCPAISHANRDRIINLIKEGSLIYAAG